jgi:hypothetical protein
LAVAGGGSRRSHATWEDNGRWMTVTITWEDDCRWMTVRGVGCGECSMGSVYTAVEDSVDGSAGVTAGGQVFGQWSRASGGRTQEIFQDTAVTLNRTEQEHQDIFDFVHCCFRRRLVRPRRNLWLPPRTARPASTREQACEPVEKSKRWQEVQKSKSKMRSPRMSPRYTVK